MGDDPTPWQWVRLATGLKERGIAKNNGYDCNTNGLITLNLEEKGVVESLRRSAGLVRGRFWRALGTVVFGGIVALFTGVLVAIVVSVFRFGDGKNVVLILSLVGVGLGLLLVAPLYVSFLVVLFGDLRARERDLSAKRAG